ncbi:MAG: hypothetical protein U9R34_07270 [Nanoarchaeota archaeon]|nr:hypothetical protein [Nanoarchaeota archaeon]
MEPKIEENNIKYKRVKQIIQYLWKKNNSKPIYSVIDIGCESDYMALQIAKVIDCNVNAVYVSSDECKNAKARIDNAVSQGVLRPGQVSVYLENKFELKTKISNKKYDLVSCADRISSYESIDNKTNLVQKIFDYKAEKGSVLITALCCQDDAFAKKYHNNEVIKYNSNEEIAKVLMFDETTDFYISLFEDIKGEKIKHKRLDQECVLFYI